MTGDNPRLDIEQVIAEARSRMLEQGSIPPTVIAVGTKQIKRFIPEELSGGGRQKAQIMFTLGLMASREPLGLLRQVVMLSEGWLSKTETGEIKVRPTLDPNRIEVVFLHSWEMKEKRSFMIVYRILRAADGTVSDLEFMTDTRTDGEISAVQFPLIRVFVDGYRRGKSAYN